MTKWGVVFVGTDVQGNEGGYSLTWTKSLTTLALVSGVSFSTTERKIFTATSYFLRKFFLNYLEDQTGKLFCFYTFEHEAIFGGK